MTKVDTFKIKIALVCVFVAIESVLFAMFLAEDFGEAYVGENIALKYSTVVTAFVFSLGLFVFLKKGDRQSLFDSLLLSLGLCLTLVSDLFLLVIGDYYEVGLVTFIGAQLCYFARIKRNKIWLTISICVRVALSAAGIAALFATGNGELLYVLVAIYFVQLVMNFAENVALIIITKDKAERIQAIVLLIGFLLFIGCDISVGLMNLYGVAGEFIWLFYTPSQVLIALSNRRIYEK